MAEVDIDEGTYLKSSINQRWIENGDLDEKLDVKSMFKNWNCATLKKRLPYYIPIMAWGPKCTRFDLLDDIVSGITISCVLIPQALGLSDLAFLPPIYGLYTAFVPSIIYAFLGTSKHLSVGPEAAISLMTGQVLMGFENLGREALIDLAQTIALLVGIFALVAGFLRLGYLDSIFSKPIANGFITAVACVVMIEQSRNLFGISKMWNEGDSAILKLWFTLTHLKFANSYSCAIAIPGLSFLFIFSYFRNRYIHNKIFKFFPFVLFLVIISILISWGFDLESKGVIVLGYIDGGFQRPAQFRFDYMGDLIVGSLVITIVGFLESVVCAKKFADKNGYAISDNRELVAFGAINICGGLFGGYPANASLSRTNLNDAVGGKSQIANLVCATIILFTILFLLPLFYFLPKCTMAAVVFFSGFGLLEFETFLFLIKIRAYVDIFLFCMTLAITLAVNVQVGVLTSVGVSLILMVKEVSGPTFNVIGQTSMGKYKPIEDGDDAKSLDDIIIIRFKDSLFYAKIGFLRDKITRVERHRTANVHPSEIPEMKPLLGLILDISRMNSIDASALKLIIEIVKDYNAKRVKICFVKLNHENYKRFRRSGLMELVGEGNFFDKIEDAVASINSSKSQRRKETIYETGE